MTRARTRAAHVVGCLALLLVPAGAASAASAWARAESAPVPPGATVHLVFVVNGTGLLDVGLQRDVRCTLTAPDGTTTTPCSGSPRLLVAQLAPGTDAYAWDVPAPAAPGAYRVAFARADLIGLPGGGASAETTFRVVPAGPSPQEDPATGDEPLDPGSTVAPGTRDASLWTFFAILAGNAAPFGGATPAPADAARALLSVVASSAVLLVLFLAHRPGDLP